MSAPLPTPVVLATDERDQFIVSHGKSGVLGAFTLVEPGAFHRGQQVIVQTSRGVETGVVLGPATLQQSRLFGATSSGLLLRRITEQDRARRTELGHREQQLFDAARAWAERDHLAIEILDVDLLFDGQQAIIQFVGNETDCEHFAPNLEQHFRLTIRMENLAVAAPPEESARCDKPDCGKDAGGCSTCSTGGGCSSCGSKKVDMSEYFSHLRTKMENRIPLT